MTHLTFPNESTEYREARSALLAEEMALRRQIEAVAAQRRPLPPGGEVPENYHFERIGENGMRRLLEQRAYLGANGAWPRSSLRRRDKCSLGFARHDPRRAWGVHAEACLH